ncbi:MAG TPA: aminotransferase class IV [Phycisphaerae bacterium]|nr:aminotransferase class IV [Phycisphaerae bacterium]HPS53147.1 aminotransferase class IV [Phycisphaerae bacterium]
MSEKIFFNGELVEPSRAVVNINDPAVLHGSSVFEEMRVCNGVVWRFDEHLRRLADNVDFLGLRTSATSGELVDGTYAAIDANDIRQGRCRIVLTPGEFGGKPNVAVVASALPEYPQSWFDDGIDVVVSSLKIFRGDPLAGRDTGCNLWRLIALQEAARKKAHEALLYNDINQLAQASMANVFLVIAGKVFTPPRDTPVTPGITRQAVMDICGRLNISYDCDTPLTVKEMLDADEMFLTNVGVGVRPVVRIERHEVGNEKPGEITRQLMTELAALIENECKDRNIFQLDK